jgi:hypothetical protein
MGKLEPDWNWIDMTDHELNKIKWSCLTIGFIAGVVTTSMIIYEVGLIPG